MDAPQEVSTFFRKGSAAFSCPRSSAGWAVHSGNKPLSRHHLESVLNDLNFAQFIIETYRVPGKASVALPLKEIAAIVQKELVVRISGRGPKES